MILYGNLLGEMFALIAILLPRKRSAWVKVATVAKTQKAMEPDTPDSQNGEILAENDGENVSEGVKLTSEAPSFGWNSYAERINGRFAMIGFVALLVLEFFTRKDFFTWLGL